jgi:putative ABC transport system ATP-binding protein
MEPLIQVQDLVKVYSLGEVEVRALQGVSLSIDQGEFVAIMNILGFLDQPTSGQYLLENINGENLSRDELAEIRNRKIGFVFQGFNLLSRTAALENVELPLIYAGTSASKRKEMAEKALSAVGLKGREHHRPNQLSGGEQQRVAIGRALNQDMRITIIMITHEPDIASFAKRIILFRDGKVVEDRNNLSPTIAVRQRDNQ